MARGGNAAAQQSAARRKTEEQIVAAIDAVGLPPEPNPIPMDEASEELQAARIATALLLPSSSANDVIDDLYPEESKRMSSASKGARRSKLTRDVRVSVIYRNHLADLEKYRDAMWGRMVALVLEGTSDEAIRAFSHISKVAGWAAPIKVDVQNKNFNIHTMLNDPAAVREALALMSHEPGAAVAIQSDARDEYEKRHGKAIDADEI